MSDTLSSISSASSQSLGLRKKSKQKKVYEDPGDTDESSDEELDLTKECHPISYYINNRPEMINQMFSVIKGNKLRAMLPPILKNYDIDKLKLQCLDQLLGMSEKRIMSIIEGEILTSSSESEVDADSSDESVAKNPKTESTAELKSESTEQEQGKTLLEILELEMRARAIRALLSKDKEVVDLTEESEFPSVVKSEPIDRNEARFENEIEKTKKTVDNNDMDRKRRLIHEQELRNKLLKRTKQKLESNKEKKALKVKEEVSLEEPEADEIQDGDVRKDIDDDPNDNDSIITIESDYREQVVIEIDDDDDNGSENVNEDYEESHKKLSEDSGEGVSWKERWLCRKGVQKIVKSSKICAKVRKRMAIKRKEAHLRNFESILDSDSSSRMDIVEGSVQEFKKLKDLEHSLTHKNANEESEAVHNIVIKDNEEIVRGNSGDVKSAAEPIIAIEDKC